MAKKISYCSILSALAIIIGYLEKFIVIPIQVPGIKLGIANIITLILLYRFSAKESFAVLIIRILVLGILFGGVSSIIYSLTGGIVSFLVMVIGKKLNVFSIIGVSVLGSYFHNVTQILVACFIVGSFKVIYYMPFLMIVAIFTGVAIGILSCKVIEHLPQSLDVL